MNEVTNILSAIDELPFKGYRAPDLENDYFPRPLPEFIASIEHFYQSERFRGVNERLRQMVLATPSPREARKLATKHKDSCRPDWREIHTRVMACAMIYKALQHPRVMLSLREWNGNTSLPYSFNGKFWNDVEEGQKLNRYSTLWIYVKARIEQIDAIKLAVVGAKDFKNDFLLSSALEFYLKKKKALYMIVQDSRGVSDIAERWALKTYTPVLVMPGWRPRSKSDQMRRLELIMKQSTQCVIFGRKAEKNIEDAVFSARVNKTPLRFIELDESGVRIRPQRKANLHTAKPQLSH